MTPTSPSPRAPAAPLTMDPAAFRRLAHAAVDLVADHLGGIRERPVFTPMTPSERAALLDHALPEMGVAPEALLDLVRRQVFTHPMGNGHPRFFGWVNSPPAPVGIVAELLAGAMSRVAPAGTTPRSTWSARRSGG